MPKIIKIAVPAVNALNVRVYRFPSVQDVSHSIRHYRALQSQK